MACLMCINSKELFEFILEACACNSLSLSVTASVPPYPCSQQSRISKPFDPENSLIHHSYQQILGLQPFVLSRI